MKHLLLYFKLLLLLCLVPSLLRAQNGIVKGSLADTSNYKTMAYSSVALINKDSVIFRRQFTNQQGAFQFGKLPADTYRILIARPTYADYEEIIPLQENEVKDLGTISLISKENLLKEIIIKDRQAIKIKGDTVEFLVDSFLTNKSANVEDLLKKLPGIQVDKDGKITAQGQEVKRVLVDGEEFFGNDPTVATRNIQAQNVETVQVFDKKSEQTAFTGIDDGTKEKTINLTLKEDAKKGYFGKLRGMYGSKNNSTIPNINQSYGTENRYEGEAMFNKFKGKQKISVFSTLSNTTNTDMSWEDREKYLGNNIEYDEASGYMYSYFERSEGDFDGNGLPQTRYIGGHYNDKLNNDKQSYQLTATHRNTMVRGLERDYTKWILPDTTYFNQILTDNKTNRTNNSLNGKSEFKLDSFSTLVVRANLMQSYYDNISEVISENFNEDSLLVNKNRRTNSSNGETLRFDYSLVLNKKFRTAGRTVSLKFDQRINDNKRTGNLFSNTTFFNGDSSINSEQNLDQQTPASEKGNGIGATLSYTEPLSKKYFLVSSYDYHRTLNKSIINTFNKDLMGAYTKRVDSLSNELNYSIGIQKFELLLRYVTKKTNASIGAKVSHTLLNQDNVLNDTLITQKFLNFFPSARVNYKISSTSSFSFNYSGSTRQPTLQQINPIQNLSNPLVVFVGNPELIQSFRNDVSLSYNNYKPISGRSIWLSLSLSNSFNDFTNYDVVDELGRRVFKSVNVNGNQSMNFNLYYYLEIKSIDLSIGNNLRGGAYKNVNFINALSNVNNNINLNYSINFSNDKEDVYEIYFSPGISYNRSTTSLRPDQITNFYTYNTSTGISIYLPKKFEWFAEHTWNKRAQSGLFTGNTNHIINLSLNRKLLNADQLEVSVGVNDLLNQNIGFERTANSNYINEQNFLVLKRYYWVALTWHINSNRGGTNEEE